jgi:hypothetical protein
VFDKSANSGILIKPVCSWFVVLRSWLKMPFTCNIDRRGKRARLIYGVLMLLLGIILALVWAWPKGGVGRWTVAVLCAVAGGFGIFEATVGWCVVRAMGIKTRM